MTPSILPESRWLRYAAAAQVLLFLALLQGDARAAPFPTTSTVIGTEIGTEIGTVVSTAIGETTARPDTIDTSYGDEMVRSYLADQVRQIERSWLSSVSDLSDWEAQLPERRRELRSMIGLDPMPERSDMQATVTGRLEHEEFTVEKLHFQSLPGLYVTANLYIPKDRDGPLPGVLYVCGHANRTEDGVSFGSKTAYQRHAAWYARHGYVALIIDTVELGEIEGIHHGTYRYDRWWWWNRGYAPLGVETWNGIRALDYLASRPEVDADRLAVTGRSGGGIYSWLISALDDRIVTSVPTAGITDLTNYVIDDVVTGHCDCMFMVNDRRWDFAMIPALAAPRPILLANGDVDPIFPLDGVMRVSERSRQVYALYNELDRFDRLIVEAAHDDTPPLQQATYTWMHRHLKDAELEVEDPAETLFEPAELKVFDELPEDEINTRIDELFVPAAPAPEQPVERADWLEMRRGWMDVLRERTFGGWPGEDLPLDIRIGEGRMVENLRITPIDFDPQPTVRLRMWMVEHRAGPSAEAPDNVTLRVAAVDSAGWQDWRAIVEAAVDPAGTDAALLDSLIGPGARATAPSGAAPDRVRALAERLRGENAALVVVAPRGVGPTRWTETERGHGIRRSFMLVGQTVEGMQAWDIRRAAQAVRQLAGEAVAIDIEARGAMAGIALYAGIFEPDVRGLFLRDLPDTHRDGPILLNVRQVFDLPQAVAAALESVDGVHLIGGEASAWSWPRQLTGSGVASGELVIGESDAWLTR